MAFICITPNVAMVRINAREHLEEMPGNFYINLDTLVEARMKEVRKEHEGRFLCRCVAGTGKPHP